MKAKTHFYILYFFLIFSLCSCDQGSGKWNDQYMTELTPRLKSLFSETKSVCFGRFVVDIPISAAVVWGQASVPYTIKVYPEGAEHVRELSEKFINELKEEKAIYRDNVPLLLSVDEVLQPPGRIVVGYEGFQSIDDLRLNGYFNINGDGALINARPLSDEKNQTITDLISMAGRLSKRDETELPFKPGNCIENAFLSDKQNQNEDDILEHIRIGFRLKEFSDVHLSIYVAPSNKYHPEQDSLETQIKRTKDDMTSLNEKMILGATKFFREGKRQIQEWETGYEVLMRSPDEEGSLAHHDFHLRFIGVPLNPFNPYADIRFQTGVANNAAGATKASLIDEEAIAIWDKITSSIRVRPTTDKAVKSSDAAQAKRHPLGELAATGRTCPQTGWWEASEEDDIAGERRRHIQAGELMPHAVARGKRSIWEKLTGEQPIYRAATVWKLVSYDSTPSNATAMPLAGAIAQTNSDGAAVGKAESNGPGGTGDNAFPEQKG